MFTHCLKNLTYRLLLNMCTFNFSRLIHVLRKLRICVREHTSENNQVGQFIKLMISSMERMHVHDFPKTLNSSVVTLSSVIAVFLFTCQIPKKILIGCNLDKAGIQNTCFTKATWKICQFPFPRFIFEKRFLVRLAVGKKFWSLSQLMLFSCFLKQD